MGFQGIDIRENGGTLVIRASLKDVNGDLIATGDADLMLLRLLNTGGFETFNFTSFDWIGQTNTNSDMFGAMTHQGVGASGAEDTGLWTFVLDGTDLADFANGDLIVAVVRHADASPPQQEHEFQFGGGIIADVRYVKNNSAAADKVFQVFGTDWLLVYDDVSKRWNTGQNPTGGLFDLVIVVDDGTDPIQNALVRIQQNIVNGYTYYDYTDADGEVAFGVNSVPYRILISADGFFFTPVTFTPSGSGTVTYSMTPVSIIPSEPGLTTGYLTTYSNLGLIEPGVEIFCTAINTGSTSGIAIGSEKRREVSDSLGVATFTNLIKGLTYQFYRAKSPEKAINVDIPTDAGATTALNSLIGKDV